MIAGKRFAVLVGGSIAAYKAVEIVRELIQRQAKVRVVMSEAATKFVAPLTFQTLSHNPVVTDMFDPLVEASVGHIDIAENSDFIVAAPVTANLIAKVANGIADDISSCLLLATRAPVLFAPAMNNKMWENDITQANVARLVKHGIHFVTPEVGELACGTCGPGRLANVRAIMDGVDYIASPKDLRGMRVIVSAGPTREWIDPIRFVTNRSTGKMGYALAKVARSRGADVTLVSGPTTLTPPSGVKTYSVTTACEMKDKVLELAASPDESAENAGGRQLIFMVAAVADHQPAQISDTKLKRDKTSSYELKMVPSPDILHELGESRADIEKSSKRELRLIGFTAETGEEEELLSWGRDKLERKKVDLMVGNFVHDSFEKETNRVWLIERDGRETELATADKSLIALRVITAALDLA